MYVEPNTLDSHIRFLKRYFSIEPISRIFSTLKRKNGPSSRKTGCVLTFDDGWYDFYTNCFPILKAHEVPATVFLPTDFIGSENFFWTDRLSSLFQQRFKYCNGGVFETPGKSPIVQRLLAFRGSLESRLESAIALLKTHRNEDIEEAITELSSQWGIEPIPPNRTFLSWEEVSEMGQTGLIHFGSHTATHRILTTLQQEEVKEELKRSKETLIDHKAADPSFVAFSFPNGNYSEEIRQMVKETGYQLAVTTRKGWNHQEWDPFLLKRVPVHQDMTSSQSMLGCRIAGLF